jgi:hypothetical protein
MLTPKDKKPSLFSRCCCRSKKRASQKKLALAEGEEENKKLTADVSQGFDMESSYDLLSDAIILVEIDKRGDKHKVKFINSAAINLTGYSRTEVLGRKPNIFMPSAIADVHDGYIARWKMDKKDKEDSKSGSGDEEDPHPTIVSLENIDMTRGQIRAVPIRRKDGEEIPVYVRLNIFVKDKRVFALATIRPQHIVTHVDFADTIFHLIDKDTHHEEKALQVPLTSLTGENSRSLSSLSNSSDREEVDDRSSPSGEVLNIYINPPTSYADFSDMKKWTFQPDNLTSGQKNKYIRIIQDKILKALADSAKEKCLIISCLKPPGIPLSGDEMDTVKQQMVAKFNSISSGYKEPVTKCMLSLSTKKNNRVIVTFGN